MPVASIVFAIVFASIVAAALIEAYVKRKRKHKLAEIRPAPDKIGEAGGIKRCGLDQFILAQTEQRRLQNEGWTPGLSQDETNAPDAGEKETQDERR